MKMTIYQDQMEFIPGMQTRSSFKKNQAINFTIIID